MSSKKIRLRLYADENFPVPSCTFLRSLGVSILHSYDLGFANKSDKFHIKKAKELQRTIITIDRDFLYYSDISAKNSPGVIVISTGNSIPIHINKICFKYLVRVKPNQVKGSYIKISQNNIYRIKEGMKTKL